MTWTCDRCKVTASWMAGHESSELPAGWIEQEGLPYCLACRRQLAAEAGALEAPADATADRRAQLRRGAILEFEILRDPGRSNAEIARAIRTSVPAVLKARARVRARED